MIVEVKCEVCESKDLTYREVEYGGFYCKNCDNMCGVEVEGNLQSSKMIIGEGKIKMDEGDFIGLVTNLANDNICPGDFDYCFDTKEESWTKVLSKWIEV